MADLRSFPATGTNPLSLPVTLGKAFAPSHCDEVGVAFVNALASEAHSDALPSALDQYPSGVCVLVEAASAWMRSMETAFSSWISWVNELNLPDMSTVLRT